MECDSEQDVPPEPRTTNHLNKGRKSRPTPHHNVRKGGVCGFPRVLLLGLGLLDTALLMTALVLGMYCAKAKDLYQVSDSAFAPLIIERNFLRNQSDVVKEKLAAEVELEGQRRARFQLKVQMKQEQALGDRLHSRIVSLRAEQAQLEANRTALEDNCGRCPPGWILLKTSCYYYAIPPSNGKKSWSDARADCVGRGGDLLVINNMEEQKTINNNYPKIIGTGPQWKMGFWIGLTDVVTTGEWTWVNDVTENSTMFWQTEQPSGDEGLDGHCAAFGRNILTWRSWYNRHCEQDSLNWICEMRPS